MKKWPILTAATLLAAFGAASALAATGEELFRKHCAACHANGGNIINPKKTLQGKVLEQAGIKTAKDVVKNLRSPGKGMPKFDSKSLPDKDARAIAEYVLKTFK